MGQRIEGLSFSFSFSTFCLQVAEEYRRRSQWGSALKRFSWRVDVTTQTANFFSSIFLLF